MSCQHYVVCFLIALYVITVTADIDTVSQQPQVLPHRVEDWTVENVTWWATHVLEYPEVAALLGGKTLAVDGYTLLSLTEQDLEVGLNITNPIVLRKILTHLQVLKGKCICPSAGDGSVDIFTYYQDNKYHAWPGISISMFSPRVMALYSDGAPTIGGSTTESGFWGSLFTWIVVLLMPHAYYAFVSLRWLATNYFLVTVYVYSQLSTQYQEYKVLRTCAKGEVTWREAAIPVLTPTAIGIALWLLSFVLPYILEDILMYVWFLFLTLQMVAVCAVKVMELWESYVSKP
eukprot:PhF_6_TR35712/c0_g1_i1/m.51847